MDPIQNPFAPGAGSMPPQLAGRERVREQVRIALERARLGRPARSVLMVGLRGVGKTVLLDRLRLDAEASGIRTLRLEAPEGRSLPALLAPELRVALLKLSRVERARALAQRALAGLASFTRALKVKFEDIEVGLDFEPEPGLADNGDLRHDLQALLAAAGQAARKADSVLAIFIDELQYVREEELADLIVALHRMAQDGAPVILVGAGLPQLRGRLGEAKTYAERLFDFPELGPLSPEDSRLALKQPIEDEGARITDEALETIVELTRGYPYFIQEWGKQVWDCTLSSPIDGDDVELATVAATTALDQGFFRVRFDRLTPHEKSYLRAMATLGPGTQRSGDIAAALGREVTSLGPIRAQLIAKGLIWSPAHGATAFTVPLFDEFLLRIMPKIP